MGKSRVIIGLWGRSKGYEISSISSGYLWHWALDTGEKVFPGQVKGRLKCSVYILQHSEIGNFLYSFSVTESRVNRRQQQLKAWKCEASHQFPARQLQNLINLTRYRKIEAPLKHLCQTHNDHVRASGSDFPKRKFIGFEESFNYNACIASKQDFSKPFVLFYDLIIYSVLLLLRSNDLNRARNG